MSGATEEILFSLVKEMNVDLETVNTRLHTYALERNHKSDLLQCSLVRERIANIREVIAFVEREKSRG